MSKLTRTIAALALVLAASFAFSGIAAAQTTDVTPDYTGVSPTTQDQDAGAGDLARGAGAAGTGALPVTGGDSLPVAQLGVALLAVGAITVLAVRKRNAAASRR